MNIPFGRLEPVVNAATIQTLVTAILGLLVAFGVGLTEEQRNAVLALTGALCAMIFGTGFVTRSRVTPVA